MRKGKKYMNPYLAGIMLGLVLLAAFYISGRGLGSSGAMKSVLVALIDTSSPDHAEQNDFYSRYLAGGQNPLNNWLVFLVLGSIGGAFLSGAISGRLGMRVEKSPTITHTRRLVFALLGGVLFGIGAQLGRGCTSGAALSGMAVLSLAGFVTMMAIFGTAFVLAPLFKKNWL
jgi:uncharacterized protein